MSSRCSPSASICRPSSPPQEAAAFQRRAWRRAAARYESAWGGLTTRFLPELLRAAGAGRGHRVLDLACGPGYAADAAAALGAVPVGVDSCRAMLRHARGRLPGVPFLLGDAETLPFGSATFDRVVCNFGVAHFAAPSLAFAEARRVLRPGGMLVFTVWADPQASPGARLVQEAIDAHGDRQDVRPETADPAGCAASGCYRPALDEAGFDATAVQVTTVTVNWTVPTPVFIFESERDAGVCTAAVLAAQSSQALAAVRAAIARAVARYRDRDGFTVPYAAQIVSAGVPGSTMTSKEERCQPSHGFSD